jgi:hypothetical protein
MQSSSSSNSLGNMHHEMNMNSTCDDQKVVSPSSSSESSCDARDKNEQDEAQVLKSDDSSSLTDDNSQSSSSNLLSESQSCLKDNYEKAKREREIEQQLAEMEKKRLQEILDICLEFQRQEQSKQTTSGSEQIQKSSTSSSIASQQNQQVSIADLPSLNTVLNSTQTKTKNSTQASRNSTNSNNQDVSEFSPLFLFIPFSTDWSSNNSFSQN